MRAFRRHRAMLGYVAGSAWSRTASGSLYQL
jgi:hypothetical protein